MTNKLITDDEIAELEAADGLDAGLDDFQYRDVVSDLIPALITRLRAAEDCLRAIEKRHGWNLDLGECVCQPHLDARQYFQSTKASK